MSYRQHIKYFVDLAMAIALLLLFSWLFILISMGYLVSGESDIIYKSLRIGKGGRQFSMLKFRTLVSDEKKSLQERRFPLGDFLRLTGLDELPQLFNIIGGEISFAGPRPLPIEYLSLMSNSQQQRHLVKPGITGWAQVNGRHSISWQKKFELDLYYVYHISFYLDMRILFKTIVLLLSFRKDHSLEEEKFKGN